MKTHKTMEKCAIKLENAVAEFLDADYLWDNDSISEDQYVAFINHMKKAMYEFRESRNGTATEVKT